MAIKDFLSMLRNKDSYKIGMRIAKKNPNHKSPSKIKKNRRKMFKNSRKTSRHGARK